MLLRAGYQETPTGIKFEDDPEFSRGIRMALPASATGVVLLPAQDWGYDLDRSAADFLPPLHRFLDSMIGLWLDISSRDYMDRVRFALYIGCLINYCYYLKDTNGETVKDPAYANNLEPDHREVHYDIFADYPQKKSFVITSRHRYHVRRSREIKEGIFIPDPYKRRVFWAPLPLLLK